MIYQVRLAWRLLHGPVAGAAWHRWAFRVGVFVSTFLLLATIASITALIDQRQSRQTAFLSQVDRSTDVYVLPGNPLPIGYDQTIRVFWIEPTSAERSVLPFGVQRMPAPGTAVVSPALAGAIALDDHLQSAFTIDHIIGRDGIQSRDDLLAWVRPGIARTIAGDGSSRISEFSASHPIGVNGFDVTAISRASTLDVVSGAVGLVGIPLMILLVITLNTGATARNRRLQIIAALGASQGYQLRLTLLGNLVIAFSPVLVGALTWQLTASRLDSIPLVGYDTFPDQLVLPLGTLVGALASVLMILIVATIISLSDRPRRSTSPRPVAVTETLAVVRFAPLGFTIVALITYTLNRTALSGNILLVALILSTITAPVLAPSILRPMGYALRRLPSLMIRLASGALILQPVRRARPFLALSTMIVLGFIGTSYFAYVTINATQANSTPAAILTWSNPAADDLAFLETALTDRTVVAMGTDRGTVSLATDCPTLQTSVPGISCLSGDIGSIGPDSPLRGILFGVETIRFVPPTALETSGEALVYGVTTEGASDFRLTTAVLSLPGGSAIAPALFELRDSPVLPWLKAGLIVAFIILVLAAFFPMADSILTTAGARRHLLMLGVLPRRLAMFEGALFALPASIVCLLGLTVGVVIYAILMLILSDEQFSWWVVGAFGGAALAVTIIGTIIVSALSVWRTYHDPPPTGSRR